MKVRSTTTGVDEGLSSAMYSSLPAAVEPAGKYHWAEVVLWHGACDQPRGPLTAWVTATPPPAVITLSDSQDPDDSAGMEGAATPRAGTATVVFSEAPVSVTAVTVAVTGLGVVLVSMR